MRLKDVAPRGRVSKLAGSEAAHAVGIVVSYAPGEGFNPESHECVTRLAIAEKLAALRGYAFGGEYEPDGGYDAALYYVPSRTLDCATAAALGISGEDDLFGGVVPHPFVGTKTISHALVSDRALAPHGWSVRFADAVADCVLVGLSAFTGEDAQQAGERLLALGPVRVKPALAIGGRGQVVANDRHELAAAIDAIDQSEIARCGIAMEQHLEDVTTFSVGQVRVGDTVATYWGTQALTTDNKGAEVYGGSDLVVVRGGFAALLALDLEDDAQRAIAHAQRYDQAARDCFGGFFASRRNYDVIRGRDRDGAVRCGVLEQSWRIGGASGAEVAALETFRADPAAHAVRARCCEVYGPDARPPHGATVYYRGVDEKVGLITKYTTVEAHGDA
jgi:hypothetical protein